MNDDDDDDFFLFLFLIFRTYRVKLTYVNTVS